MDLSRIFGHYNGQKEKAKEKIVEKGKIEFFLRDYRLTNIRSIDTCVFTAMVEYLFSCKIH
jgi:hypothetical protein